MKRNLCALVALVLIAAACSDSAETTTTTLPPPSTDVHCYYLPDFVAAPAAEPLGEITDEFGLTLLDGDGVLALLSESSSRGQEYPETAADAINESLAVYAVAEGDDPLEVSIRIRDAGGSATPIHALWSAGHWSFEPGEDYAPNASVLALLQQPPEQPDAENQDSDSGPLVAVVDTGFVPTGEGWIDGNVMFDAASDTDPDLPSHGTFVASVIRQVAPAVDVSVARAASYDPARVTALNHAGWPPAQGVQLTTGLDVLIAVDTLARRHAGNPGAVLNLSLGTYTCPGLAGAGSQPAIDLAAAIDLWPGAVVAAAGNESDPGTEEFWPAAHPGVTGVAAIDINGDVMGWFTDSNDVRQRVPGISLPGWAGAEAPGVDIAGVAGPVDQWAGLWSGTSFAAPIIAALAARDGSVPGSMLYEQVEDLVYMNGSTLEKTVIP